jgi:hypothetical protein
MMRFPAPFVVSVFPSRLDAVIEFALASDYWQFGT